MSRGDDRDPLVADSRFLSYVLRHRPDAVGIALDAHGWVRVEDLLAALAAHGRAIDADRLARIVAGTDKVRLEVDGDRIRAAQGHSVRVDLDLPGVVPPDVLWHGTVERSLPSILADGLRRGRRTHVHLSADAGTARTVGGRRGAPVLLTVYARTAHADGVVFHRAANGVWLVADVPARYLAVHRDAAGTTAARPAPGPRDG